MTAALRRYTVESFPRGTRAGLEAIRDKLQNTTWVVSFNSPHQLETAAAVRLGLAHAYGSMHSDARPLVTADEVDQIVRSKTRSQIMEKRFDAVLGMFERTTRVSPPHNFSALLFKGTLFSSNANCFPFYQVTSTLKRQHLCGGIADKEYRLPPVLGVVATTSTPVTFVWQFSIDFKQFAWTLDGWVLPGEWSNYTGLQHYRPSLVEDHMLNKGNKYLFDSQVYSVSFSLPYENLDF